MSLPLSILITGTDSPQHSNGTCSFQSPDDLCFAFGLAKTASPVHQHTSLSTASSIVTHLLCTYINPWRRRDTLSAAQLERRASISIIKSAMSHCSVAESVFDPILRNITDPSTQRFRAFENSILLRQQTRRPIQQHGNQYAPNLELFERCTL